MKRRISYSMALRCIGQDLELRGLRTFVIEPEAGQYLVRCGYQSPPAEMPVTLSYTDEDIEALDQAGKERRGKVPAPKEFLNPVQILRTIGGYLDRLEARLIRISNNHPSGQDGLFKTEYETQDGERVTDDRAGSAIYDLCVSMYKQRGRLTGTGSRYGRWR
ncbi:MAG TPA: hypothetical protein VNN77_11945 [candidate division Zixibacteria bacterium]|nr:hypothetical protein [candidate division Zixibacteria bacterium]